MLIINADDWGRCAAETDAALRCHQEGRITSASAMMFMADSERAAGLALQTGLDIGLHVNLSQRFDGRAVEDRLREAQGRIVRFLKRNKYALLIYNPFLKADFRYVIDKQWGEFQRLYGKAPSHVDGHQHMHLCSNVLLDGLLPEGVKVRRSFSFGPGQKSFFNRAYRGWVDRSLARRHRMTDYFFNIAVPPRQDRFANACGLAREKNVEVMTHPVRGEELQFLLSREFEGIVEKSTLSTYAAL